MILGVLYVGIDGIRNGLGYWQLTARYIVLLYVMKAFDIIVQDQWLVMTVSALTLPEEEYDLATAFETIYFWPGLKECFSQVASFFSSSRLAVRAAAPRAGCRKGNIFLSARVCII